MIMVIGLYITLPLEYFDFTKEEGKLIKTYQVLTQYLLYSINHLKKKNTLITDLSNQQRKYNEAAADILDKQKKKIRELEQANNDYTNNCMSMEFLIKHLNLEHLVMKLGVKSFVNNNKDGIPLNEKEYEKIQEEVKHFKNREVNDDKVDDEEEYN